MIPSGILLVDKPMDWSSAKAVAVIKRLSGKMKTGHAGTLDPFATGLLVICLGKATRLAGFLLASSKTYIADMVLGADTDTQDRTGTVLAEKDVPQISEDEMKRLFEMFVGEQKQVPPAYSALKQDGQPLYKLARKGQMVLKPPREITVYDISLIEMALPLVRFEVTVSAGTYIRTLCADMGQKIGCGAYLKELRRTKSGFFEVEEAFSIEALERQDEAGWAEKIRPMNAVLPDFTALRVSDDVLPKIKNGVGLTPADLEKVADREKTLAQMKYNLLKILDKNDELVALVQAEPKDAVFPYHSVFI